MIRGSRPIPRQSDRFPSPEPPGSAFPLPALAALADAGVPAVLQPYRADLPHLLGFAGLVVLFTALLGRAGVAAALVLGFAHG